MVPTPNDKSIWAALVGVEGKHFPLNGKCHLQIDFLPLLNPCHIIAKWGTDSDSMAVCSLQEGLPDFR